MPYTYLDLVNEICRKVNEVELSSSNFATATGFYGHAKDGINRAISDIDVSERYWPFNFTQGSQLLVAGTMKYSFPANAKVVDFDSFVIPEDATLGNDTVFLRPLTYDDYKQNYSHHEFSTNTSLRNLPMYVARSPADEFILVPSPDKAYTVRFDYFANTTELVDYDDVPSVPQTYRNVLITGAMRDAALFRENSEDHDRYEELFRKQLKSMRMALINQNYYVRSRRRFLVPSFAGQKTLRLGE